VETLRVHTVLRSVQGRTRPQGDTSEKIFVNIAL